MEPPARALKRVAYLLAECPADGRGQANQVEAASAASRDHNASLRLSQVDGRLCTHIVLAPLKLAAGVNMELAAPASDSALASQLAEVADFRRQHPAVRLLISLTGPRGWLTGPSATCESRRHFARVAVGLLQRFRLDGLNLELGGAREPDRADLVRLLSDLRSAFVANYFDRQLHSGANTGRADQPVEQFLLTCSLTARDWPGELAHYCDWLHVMSFNYYQALQLSPFTGPLAPLYPPVDSHVPLLGKLAVSCTVKRLLAEAHLEPEKLVLGVATFGRAYRLVFRSEGRPPAAFHLAQAGASWLTFGQVGQLLEKPDSRRAYDARARVPYLLAERGTTWVTYEDEQSVREKVRHIAAARLAGYVTYGLNFDSARFPLHMAMLDEALCQAGSLAGATADRGPAISEPVGS